MASSTTYTYQTPTALATRSLISGQKPAETVSSSSFDNEDQDRPVLQRQTTNHYQEAVAAASALKAESDAAEDNAKPILDRQPSWKHTDMKRLGMEKIIADTPASQGYTTTSK